MLSNGKTIQCCIVLLSLSWTLCGGQAAKILGIFPVPGRSHYILESTLMKALADSGHHVTIVSPFKEDYKSKNGSYNEIVLTGFLEAHAERRKAVNLFEKKSINPLTAIYIMSKIGLKLTENTLKHENMQKLMKSGEKFDAVIVGQFMNDALKGLAYHFGGHLILFSSVGTSTWVNHLVGNPSLPSYTPEMLMSFPAKMSYIQRFKNTLFNVIYNMNQLFLVYPKQNQLLKKYISNDIDLEDALFNVSLVLLNTHESIAFPSSSVPCMKLIGGFHVKQPNKLPQDLQDFLDNSPQGVIYFSMGSNVNSKDMPKELKQEIIKSFSKLKENVLWKYEDDTLTDLPKNVKIEKWLPQQDILAHPNIKLFITHAGYASTIESVHHAVPIIAIPIFGDQTMNAVYAETKGFGILLPWHTITEEKLSSTIREVIDSPKYKENAKRKSQLLRDRETQPIDTARYWIDYVLKHNGAAHLRVASLELSWYQYYLLDIYLPIIALIYILFKLIKKAFTLLIHKRPEKEKEL
ncbi:UDP-glucosyltransferase 2-like isoform X2 [Rhynchophorus ferrugineus]|uniref:UDP-glucosyltransferase 2-like isoform X2 n=1 Tax=Rhynchophorus ferrugineus TaxID=354439 RepID=UPI003FCD949A